MARLGWADVADDLLFLLAERVPSVATFIRLSAVCKLWYRVASATQCCSSVPLLMLGEREGSDLRDFYDHSTGEVYELHLPQARGCRSLGSAHGWLITANAREGDYFHLLNPLTGTQITLPCTNAFPSKICRKHFRPEKVRDSFMIKATCSPIKSDKDYIVFATHMGVVDYNLSYCRSKDKEWSTFEYWGPKDIGFVAGVFFTITYSGEIFVIDIASGSLVKIVDLPKYGRYHTQDCQCC